MITSVSIVILATLGYHLAQNFVLAEANPAVVLLAAYSVALVFTLAIFYLYPMEQNLATELRLAGWQSVGLGFAVVGIEIGFLLVYRTGWQLSTAGLVANAAVALILLPIGYFFLKERLGPINLVGIFVCVVGLIMINFQK